jgi:hypothetical protein
MSGRRRVSRLGIVSTIAPFDRHGNRPKVKRRMKGDSDLLFDNRCRQEVNGSERGGNTWL